LSDDITLPNYTQKSILEADPTQKDNAVMVSLDFSTLHERTCKGYGDPSDPDSDYEYWTPHDGRHMTSNSCFMGQ
jgi:hypothetical protein